MNDPQQKCACSCGRDTTAPALVYPCSGAADVGEIADRAARRLGPEDEVRMSCLAGIGGRVSGLMASAEAARFLLAIDGCPLDCARKTLEAAGFPRIRHVRVTDLGLTKGKSPATDEAVRRVVDAATAVLHAPAGARAP